jgi:hypothetical protein
LPPREIKEAQKILSRLQLGGLEVKEYRLPLSGEARKLIMFLKEDHEIR